MAAPYPVRLGDDLESKLSATLAERGGTKAAAIRAAVEEWVDREQVRKERDAMEARIAATMSAVRGESRKTRNDLHVLMSMLDQLIRTYLLLTPQLPDESLEAAAAAAQDRYTRFLERVGKGLSGVDSVASRIHDGPDDGAGR